MSDKWLPMTVDEFRRAEARSTAREDAIQKLHSESPPTIQELGEIAETLRPEELVEPYEPQKNMLTDHFPRGIHYDFMEAERNKIIEAGPRAQRKKRTLIYVGATSTSDGTRGPLVRGALEITHERPGRSEHWIIDDAGQRHLVYQESLYPIEPLSVPEAFAVLKAAIQEDFGYAWSWHCNIAMAFYDESDKMWAHGAGRGVCNAAAARFMRQCFDVDTSQEAADRHHTKKEE